MKRMLSLVLLSICFTILLLVTPQRVEAALDMGGVWVHVQTSAGTDLPGATVTVSGNAAAGSYTYWPLDGGGSVSNNCNSASFVHDDGAGTLTRTNALSGTTNGAGNVRIADGYVGHWWDRGKWGLSCTCNNFTVTASAPGYHTNSQPAGLANADNSFAIALVPTTPPPNGSHDDAVCVGNPSDHTWGWTCDPLNFSYQSDVHMYIDGPAGVGAGVNTGAANVYRPDLQSPNNLWACNGIGSHGFDKGIDYLSEITELNLRNGGAHSIYAYAFRTNGTPYLINNSPKTFTCPVGAGVEIDATNRNVTLSSVCSLNSILDNVEQGTPTSLTWDINNETNSTPSQITYRTENAVSCTASANPARSAWSGAKPASNGVWSSPISDSPTQTTKYYIQCRDAAGRVGPKRNVKVNVADAPSGSYRIESIAPPVTIRTWTGFNGSAPTVSGSPINIMPTATTTYRMDLTTGPSCTKQINVRPRNSTTVNPVAP